MLVCGRYRFRVTTAGAVACFGRPNHACLRWKHYYASHADAAVPISARADAGNQLTFSRLIRNRVFGRIYLGDTPNQMDADK